VVCIKFYALSQGNAFGSGGGSHRLPARGALEDTNNGGVDGHVRNFMKL
jgi:hypothetical protein